MTNDMLAAFQIIDQFERDYASHPSGLPIVVDLVEYYPAKRAYWKACDDFYKAALAYARLQP